jgi:hypothetical protein
MDSLLSNSHRLKRSLRCPSWVVLLPAHLSNFPRTLGSVNGASVRVLSAQDADFHAAAWGFAAASVRERLHIRDLAGQWHTGLDAELLLRALHAQAERSDAISASRVS